MLQFFLAPAEFFELAFLFLDLFLLALELEQLLLRFLHLRIEMLALTPIPPRLIPAFVRSGGFVRA